MRDALCETPAARGSRMRAAPNQKGRQALPQEAAVFRHVDSAEYDRGLGPRQEDVPR